MDGNQVTTSSGAIYNYGAGGTTNLTVSNSTIHGNLVTGSSGGSGVMENYGGTASFTNCTFYNNSAFSAGAIYNNGVAVNASITLRDCTFSANTTSNSSSADLVNTASFGGAATLTLSGNIFKTGAQGPNFLNSSGTVISQGYNLSNDAAGGDGSTGPGGLLNATGDIRNTDPALGSLANNGGPTLTVALLSGSPAINHGDPGAPPTDQRYYARSDAPDIGAFEFNGTLAPVSAVSRKTHGAVSFDIPLSLAGTAGVECRTGGATNDFQMVVTFPTSVTLGNVSVTTGAGSVSRSSIYGGEVTVNLAAVANAQRIVVTLFNVNDGANIANVTIPMSILLGDTNGDGFVNAGDAVQTRSRAGQGTNATNFRSDVNTDGVINSGDTAVVRAKSGTSLP